MAETQLEHSSIIQKNPEIRYISNNKGTVFEVFDNEKQDYVEIFKSEHNFYITRENVIQMFKDWAYNIITKMKTNSFFD